MLARMMRSRLWSTSLLVGLCSLTVSCAASNPPLAVTSPTLTPCPSPTATNDSTAPQTGYPGIPAITPHLNLEVNAAGTASGGTATLPTFTADDASAWVMAHGLRPFKATGTMTVRSVTFLCQEQASQLQNPVTTLDQPASTLLCFVVLDGTFTHPMAQQGSNPPLTYLYAVAVFNGVTGNLVGEILANSLPAALATPTTSTTPGTGTSTPTS
jgi:hypothetical protein